MPPNESDDDKPKFYLDPRAPPTPLPVATSYAPFQLSTQTGTVVIELTTTDGLFIFTPAWAEKVMGWYYPMDPTTRTFGRAVPLSYNIDIDQFYESYRVVSALFTLIGNTTSTTLAALSGNFNAVEAYNSLSGLVGNNSDVWQVYSYSNLLGLTSDPTRKEGAVPAYEGVGAFFLSNPRKAWARLEDSVPYSPSSSVDPANSLFKFIDQSDSYALHGQMAFMPDPIIATNTTGVIYSSGEILMDYMRASSINWSAQTTVSCNNATSYFGFKLSYKILDIAGSTISAGIMWESKEGPSQVTNLNWSRSGSLPTYFNVADSSLEPPARSIFIYFQVYGVASNGTLTFVSPLNVKIEVPIVNGLKDGLIQSPILMAHSGNEIGTKLSISGRLNLEARMNSEVNKFTQVRYRDLTTRYERAMMKVASNPAKYGLKYVFKLSQLDRMMYAWDSAVNQAVVKHVEEKIENLVEMYAHCCDQLDKAAPHERAEAASKATKVLRRIGKKLKGVSKTVAEKVLRPAAEEALALGKQTLHRGLSTLISGVAPAPYATAATGFIPTAATGFMSRNYLAATKMPSSKPQILTEEPPSESQPLFVEKKEASLFPVLYLDGDGDLVEKESTVVGLFAIIPARLIQSRPNTVRTRIKTSFIENYASTTECPTITPIEPRENAAIVRVDKILPNGYHVSQPPFCTTGRSLDLAIWAFNNRFCPGFVFTCPVNAGNISPMDPEVSVLKRKFCDENRLTLVGNFAPLLVSDKTISVKTIPELVRMMSSRSLQDNPNTLQKGWFYASTIAEFDTNNTPLAYDGTHLIFRDPIDVPKPARVTYLDGHYYYRLTFSQRYGMEKMIASFFDPPLETLSVPNVPAALALAATSTKAQAAITLRNYADFKSIFDLIGGDAVNEKDVKNVWKILTLSHLNATIPSTQPTLVFTPAAELREKNVEAYDRLVGVNAQPSKNTRGPLVRKKGRQGPKVIRDNFILSPYDIQKDVLFPVDMRVYRQFLSDPSLITDDLPQPTKALLYLTFQHFPYQNPDGTPRVSKRNKAAFDACKKATAGFSDVFHTTYDNISGEALKEVQKEMKLYRLPPNLKAQWTSKCVK